MSAKFKAKLTAVSPRDNGGIKLKKMLKRLVRKAAKWPILGRSLQVMIGVIRCPNYIRSQHDFEVRQLPEIMNRLSVLEQRLVTLEETRLQSVLQTISDLQDRQTAAEKDWENIVGSVPVSLRKITRDVIALRRDLSSLSGNSGNRPSDPAGMSGGALKTSGQEESEPGATGESMLHPRSVSPRV
ncbi:MAG: hypothetical protein HIU89_00100 [Proteobacteria bacterium]|nr:hypothetical protein [Pseudomonadota bacterium]